jgi:hypothetical protein
VDLLEFNQEEILWSFKEVEEKHLVTEKPSLNKRMHNSQLWVMVFVITVSR